MEADLADLKLAMEVKLLENRHEDKELDVKIKNEVFKLAEEKARLAKIKREKEEKNFLHKDELKLELIAKFVDIENILLCEIGAKKHQKKIRKIFDGILGRNLTAQIAE